MALTQVSSAGIKNAEVKTEDILDANITTAKIAADAITAAKIADDAIGAEHIETLDATVDWNDDVGVRFGASNDLQIRHNNSGKSIIYHSPASAVLSIAADHLNLADYGNEHPFITCDRDGSVDLYYDNSKKLETTANGIQINDYLLALKAGSGSDAHLQLIGDNGAQNNDFFRFTSGAGISAWENYSSGSWVTNLRVKETGEVQIPNDTGKYECGASGDLKIYHDGSNSIIKNTTGTLQITADSSEFVNAANSEYKARYINNGAVELYHDGSLRSYTSANGFQVKKASSDDVEFRLVNTQNTTAGATNTILSEHDARTTAKIVFGRNNDANDFSASAASTQGDIQFYTTASGTLTQHGRFINTGYFHVCNDGNFVDCSDSHAARSTNASWAFRAVNSHASTPYGVHAYFNNSDPDTGNYPFFLGQDQTTTRFRVQSNGNVENHDNSYGSISDIKLKENIVDAGSQWEDIKAIKVRNFNFKASKSKKKLLGVVAQELETTSPGLVVETPDEDLDHNDLGTTTKSVRYSILYMKAIKALQEAMAKIETLETEVAALKAK
ncbi:tail fiber protein [Cyanophage NATL1A-7]|uniref:Predicted protein n=1 Tax=Cyanophage NATL1A-7 TaxID=445693 RepID=E3SND2_9CAUD|nr:tail fiber protein [Cyanophage NATL1A-7]ADP00136.1 predicted protein [Cyanophage NATL1A-7]